MMDVLPQMASETGGHTEDSRWQECNPFQRCVAPGLSQLFISTYGMSLSSSALPLSSLPSPRPAQCILESPFVSIHL